MIRLIPLLFLAGCAVQQPMSTHMAACESLGYAAGSAALLDCVALHASARAAERARISRALDAYVISHPTIRER